MRNVIYSMSVSLDGFVETVHGDISWSFPDEELHRQFNEREREIGLHFFGRRMYELMADYWPAVETDPLAHPHEVEYSRIWKAMPKVVFSRTLSRVDWNARLVREDVAGEVSRLKAQPGGDMSVSGAGLAASFLQLGLVDEAWLYVYPVVLGDGTPMFPPLRDPLPLELVETRTFGHGVVMMRYRKKGD